MIAGKIAAELVSSVKQRMQGNNSLERVEVVVREVLNEVGVQMLSTFSEQLVQEEKVPLCPKCQQSMTAKELVVTTIRSTFGDFQDHAIDYQCKECKTYKRTHGYERPERARLSPLFSAMLVLFGATWPQQVALFCALVTFGQKVCKTTLHNLLQQEPAPTQTYPLILPEQPTVCADGVLVNGREKGRKIEAKVLSIFSATEPVGPKEKQKVQDVSFIASGNKGWNELSGPVLQELAERGVTDFSQVLCVGDGAEGIWGMFEYGAPKGSQMLDEYHTKKKVTSRCKEQFEKGDAWEISCAVNKELDLGDIDEAIRTLLSAWAEKPAKEGQEDDSRAVDKLVAYLRRHQKKIETRVAAKQEERTKGTGLQEKANDVVCAKRCKEGEMHWSRDGLEHILQHRCAILNQVAQALAA